VSLTGTTKHGKHNDQSPRDQTEQLTKTPIVSTTTSKERTATHAQ